MTTGRQRSNRGPAAAAANRSALLDAARRLFAERGYDVPLNAIAKEAGVGQGVLYRNFPTRLDLAFAAFEENFVELEEIAADPDPRSFHRLWSALLDQTIREAAFVAMVVDSHSSAADYDGGERLHRLVATALTRAQSAGAVDATVTVEDVLLAQRMAYGIVVTDLDRDPARLRATIERALNGGWHPTT